MHIPPELLWFRLPDEKGELALIEPAASQLASSAVNGVLERSAGMRASGARPASHAEHDHTVDPEHDPVLVAPWNHRGTVEVAVLLSGGGSRVKRRVFLSLTGPALTAPAHQWLVHEPEPLVSGLTGRRVSGAVCRRVGNGAPGRTRGCLRSCVERSVAPLPAQSVMSVPAERAAARTTPGTE